ncbi:MAG: glycoside hydrolase family 3 C-terminal domain-containing protein [Firmicutes bacterium]|nr:glycoside hydrolase family 3 C-terminal domain-containing protein [Bacillota bacterium]
MNADQIRNFDDALAVMEQAGIEPVTSPTSNHPELAHELAKKLVSLMNLKEKAHMLSGHWAMLNGMLHGRIYNYDPIAGGGCKRLGIPPLLFSDGPRGVVMKNATCFPTSNTRAAAFDTSLEEEVGKVIAKECIALGANYFAGVCINLLRHPSWGRAQEAYGEDQFLTGKYGVALTKGLQKYGVISCPKHYYMNSIENLRFSVSANADEETLRDIYLYHFEECFKAGAGSVMSAYNRVNGIYCGENKDVFDHLKTLGFEGFSISDFVWGVHDGPESLKAGLDVEMPLTLKRGGRLIRAVKKGILEESLLDEHCENIIATMLRFQGIYRQQQFSKSVVTSKAHTSLAQLIMEKGAVLLKNDGSLPVRDTETKIALVGRFANEKVIGDHGSSMVHPPYITTPYEGLKKVFPNVTLASSNDIEKCKEAAKDAHHIVAVLGNDYRDEGEFIANAKSDLVTGGDRKSLRLHKDEVSLIHELAALSKPLTVIFYSGSAVITAEWKDEANAILYAGYPGMEGGTALARILSGKVNPSGKLPFTVAQKEEDYPSFPYTDEKDQQVEYGYYHGYALFEKEGIEPEYPFGFGLSYTTFDYSNAAASDEGDRILVRVDVANTGDVYGEEAVLVFIGSGIEGKPHKLLKGFARASLQPGKAETVTIEIPKEDLRLYDPEKKDMIIPSDITVYVGKNIQDAENRVVKL